MRIYKMAQSSPERSIQDPKAYEQFDRFSTTGMISWKQVPSRWSHQEQGDTFTTNGTFLGYISYGGRPSKIYSYKVTVNLGGSVDGGHKSYRTANAILSVNSRRSRIGEGEEPILQWSYDGGEEVKDQIQNEFDTGIKLTNYTMPWQEDEAPSVTAEDLPNEIRLTKPKDISTPTPAQSIEVHVDEKKITGYIVWFRKTNLETGEQSEKKRIGDPSRKMSPSDVMEIINDILARTKSKGFVGDKSFLYYPVGATQDNYDFSRHKWTVPESEIPNKGRRKVHVEQPSSPVDQSPQIPAEEEIEEEIEEGYDDGGPSIGDVDLKDLLASNKKKYKIAQAEDFEGFFLGEIPDYAVNMLGTSSVDSSQLKGLFGKVDDAVQLVNQFDPSLLQNVSFIFNFSRGGAYGVYLAALDRAIKIKALKKELERMGYIVSQGREGVSAYVPEGAEPKSSEQIQSDIDGIYNNLESSGGSAFGINMNEVLTASREEMANSQSEDPNLWEWFSILHLAETIVHEAVHAKGYEGEAEPQQAEIAFVNSALPIIDQKYRESLIAQGKEELYAPLQITGEMRHAMVTGWYRRAQTLPYFLQGPQSPSPVGSDLAGRFHQGINSDQGRASWGMEMQQDQNISIETRLGRQYMSPLPPGLDQSNDSIEEQLRKYRSEDDELDTKASMEELLSNDHDETSAYYTLEELLEEERPIPLLLPLEKTASIKKIATVFGWMNNLEISDGNTIPGLSDRVMAWDDRDESFVEEEEWIRKQPRYNPSYDIKGIYYRQVDPRLKPTLWTDYNAYDRANVSPARRFAQKADVDTEIYKIVSIFSVIKRKVSRKDISSTRMLMTDDIIPLVIKIFSKFRVDVFDVGITESGEKVCSVWVSDLGVQTEEIERAEAYFQDKSSDNVNDLLEKLFGLCGQRDKMIDDITGELNIIAEEHGLKGFIFGQGDIRILPNDVILFKPEKIKGDRLAKIISLLSERLGSCGVDTDISANVVYFDYKGHTIVFRAG